MSPLPSLRLLSLGSLGNRFAKSNRRARRFPRLECLEDRTVPTDIPCMMGSSPNPIVAGHPAHILVEAFNGANADPGYTGHVAIVAVSNGATLGSHQFSAVDQGIFNVPVVFPVSGSIEFHVTDTATGAFEDDVLNVTGGGGGGVNVNVKDAAFTGDTQHIVFHYATTPTSFTGNMDVGVYWSKDQRFDASDTLVQAVSSFDVTGNTGQITLNTQPVPDPDHPYLLVVADPNHLLPESSRSNNVEAITLPVVRVKVSGGVTLRTANMGPSDVTVANVPALDLMHKGKFFPTATPSAGKVDFYKIEQRPFGGGAWTDMADIVNPSPPPVLVQRLAGDFEYRATININGVDYTTPDTRLVPVKVRFPNYNTVMADAAVKTFTKAAWEDTLNFTDQNHTLRREEGFWVQFNTATGAYTATATVLGPAVDNSTPNGEVSLGNRASDIPSADGLSAIYTVASFHTHTPTAFRDMGGQVRPVGPSGPDSAQAGPGADDCPGLVYDYLGKEFELPGLGRQRAVPSFWALHSPAKLWHTVVQLVDGTVIDRRTKA